MASTMSVPPWPSLEATKMTPTRSPSSRSKASTAPMGKKGRDAARPRFTDHGFTGDYATPLTDRNADSSPHQLSLVAEAS